MDVWKDIHTVRFMIRGVELLKFVGKINYTAHVFQRNPITKAS